MIARLWWKEFRQFWPIWLTVFLGAALSQWFQLLYWGAEVRQGWLLSAALLWASLYAVAVGAAAFAAERELKTLVLLDTLPVGRVTLWLGKISFSTLSTFALGLALLGLAAIATDRLETPNRVQTDVMLCVGLTAVALCWGLFWSSISKTSLAAATLAVFSLITFPLCQGVAAILGLGYWGAAIPSFGLAVITIGTSALVMIYPMRSGWRWPGPNVRLRMPIVMADRPRAAEREQISAWESWTNAIGRLIWETLREGRGTYAILVSIGLVSVAIAVLFLDYSTRQFIAIGNIVIGLSAGISVFGGETRSGTERFLASHGVRPGAIWLTKLAVWSFGLSILWTPYFLIWGISVFFRDPTHNDPSYISVASLVLNGFAAGQLSGMLLKRGITAWFISVISAIAVMAPQAALLATGLMTPPWILATPLAILAISWGWSGDWLVAKPGLARYARLALLMVMASGITVSAYALNRVWSVPDFGLALDRQYLQVDIPKVPDSENAASLIRNSGIPLLRDSGALVAAGKMAEPKADATWSKAPPDVLVVARRAAAMPSCQVFDLNTITFFSALDLSAIRIAFQYLHASAEFLTSQDDLDAAWSDILAELRLARTLGRYAPINQSLVSSHAEQQALRLAMAWAARPKQTPDRLTKALTDLRNLPNASAMDETIRIEARIADQTLNSPDLIRRDLMDSDRSEMVSERFFRQLHRDSITTPWEMARARRVLRLLFASEVEITRRPIHQPYSHPAGTVGFVRIELHEGDQTRIAFATDLEDDFQTTPLAKIWFPAFDAYRGNRAMLEVNRAALLQILAIRFWQFHHGGKISESLETMLGVLYQTPRDPFSGSGKAFGWVLSHGQLELPLGEAGVITRQHDSNRTVSTKGQWLLYSVGQNRIDDGATTDLSVNGFGGDIVYPIPSETPQKEPEPKE